MADNLSFIYKAVYEQKVLDNSIICNQTFNEASAIEGETNTYNLPGSQLLNLSKLKLGKLHLNTDLRKKAPFLNIREQLGF